ncbi:M50 family metallopeptidase [Aquibacillus sediminis]|uniref:M50 family metallopeptidase n=1 Tax=Aquibacillus sediminis TaxID=2574734 RepID=UPI001107F648|nr:M50 family metallopeptidase [Aquibacillus sediminis]
MEVSYYLLLAFLLTKLPVIGNYLKLLNTMVHELFHVLAATLTGGKGYQIKLFADTTGQAKIHSSSWISGVLVSYAGYTGSSLMALLLFYLLHEGYYTPIIVLFFILSITTVLFWIRNWFGFLWITSFIVILWLILKYQLVSVIQHLSYLLASIILVESIVSTLHIMLISFRHPQHAGDATSLQQTTKLPAVLWGSAFFVQSSYIGYTVLQNYVF